MPKKMWTLLVALACAALLGLGLLTYAAPPSPVTKWEYGTLAGVEYTKWSWATPTESVSGGIEEVYRALGGKKSNTVSSLNVQNQIGQQGWELVSVLMTDPGGHSFFYYFKRPAG